MIAKNNSTDPLVIERTFNAPVAQVWKALTDADEMRRWYFDLDDFKPQVGFEFQFVVEHDGNMYDHRCKVTEVVPRQKLAYTWRYAGLEGDSLVTFELFAESDKTRLKLTHEGLDTFPKLPNFGRENFTRGWTELIGSSLKEYLEQPGYRLMVKRDFNAPCDLVWKAWTEPEQLIAWLWSGDEDMTIESVKMDLRVGGKFRIQQMAADGEYYTAVGTYLEVKASERLVHTWDWEKDGAGEEFGELEGNETQVTVEFHERGELTRVVLTHEKFAAEKSRDNHEHGWTKWLDQAAEFIEIKHSRPIGFLKKEVAGGRSHSGSA